VDPALHEVAERGIDHPLSIHTALPREKRTFNREREVTLSSRIVAAMAAVLLTIVDQIDARGRKRRIEALKHLGCDRSRGDVVHSPYIEGFYGVETGKDARKGRRGEGALRRARLQLTR
jgi:hypothetical protein